MSYSNRIQISGEVINKPVLETIDSGPILSFAVEYLEDGGEGARLVIRVDVHGEKAVELDSLLACGDWVTVDGKLRYARWTNKRGEQHKTYLVEAVDVQPAEEEKGLT